MRCPQRPSQVFRVYGVQTCEDTEFKVNILRVMYVSSREFNFLKIFLVSRVGQSFLPSLYLLPMEFIVTSLRRIGRGVLSKLFSGSFMLGWMGWDFSLFLVNLITFKRKVGHVTPRGRPGEAGFWPQYLPPSVGDSRSLCPALNALANHGLLFLPFFSLSFRHPRWRFHLSESLLCFSRQVSSLVTDAISLSAIYPHYFRQPTISPLPSAFTCSAT
jgi:Peroxidase, family 2